MANWANPELGTALIEERGQNVIAWTPTRWRSADGNFSIVDQGPQGGNQRYALHDFKSVVDPTYSPLYFARFEDAMAATAVTIQPLESA